MLQIVLPTFSNCIDNAVYYNTLQEWIKPKVCSHTDWLQCWPAENDNPPCFLLFMVMVRGLQSRDLYFSTFFPYLCILPPKEKEKQKSPPAAVTAPPLPLHGFCCCRYHCQCQSHAREQAALGTWLLVMFCSPPHLFLVEQLPPMAVMMAAVVLQITTQWIFLNS